MSTYQLWTLRRMGYLDTAIANMSAAEIAAKCAKRAALMQVGKPA